MSKPTSFVECCESLQSGGMDPDKACRACSIAFWESHGMTVESAERYGVNPGGSLESRAWMSTFELSDSTSQASPHFRVGGEFEIAAKLEDKVNLDSYAWAPEKPKDDKPKLRSLMREVQFLRPGKWAGYDFTDEDLEAFALHFDATDCPPILLDHELTVKNLSGYIRGLRYEPPFPGDERGGTLWALWEFLGDHACQQVEAGLWKRVSGGFIVGPELKDKRVMEGSVVLWGAYDRGIFDRAQILRRDITSMSLPNNPAVTQPPAAAVPPAPAPATEPAPVAEPVTLSAQTPKTEEASPSFLARLEAVEKENARLVSTARLKADEDQVLEFVSLGKSVPAPEVGKAELAFLQSLPEGKLREDYIKLRKQLPNVYPAGGQLSVPTVQEPGSPENKSLQNLTSIAQGMGLIATAAASGKE